MRIALFTLLAGLTFHAVGSEEPGVYLIASEPHINHVESFPTVLYRVEDGGLVKVRTVTTQLQDVKFGGCLSRQGLCAGRKRQGAWTRDYCWM